MSRFWRKTIGLAKMGAILGIWGAIPILTFPRSHMAYAQSRSDTIDVILVVDTSGSMKTNDPENIRISAAKLFVDMSSEGDRIGIVSMSGEDHTQVIAPLTPIGTWLGGVDRGREALKEALEELSTPIPGGTFMGAALRYAYEMLDKTEPGRRQFVVFLTDGVQEAEAWSILDEVLTDFEVKRFWKIFAIALGEEADLEFLQHEIAERTGGRAYRASTPQELIRVYTELFATLRHNTYVNFISVQANSFQRLFTVSEEQKITNITFVVPRSGSERRLPVDLLISPNDVNIIDMALAGGVYHAEDPRYEVYILGRDALLLEGEWRIRLLGEGVIEVAALVRSDLGIKLLAPPPQYTWDELSETYTPLGRPIFIQVGVPNAGATPWPALSRSLPRGPEGELEKFLAPVVRLKWPPGGSLTLRDDGLAADIVKEDGHYSGLQQVDQMGEEYVIEIEIPFHKEEPIRLLKERTIQARVLPVTSIELPPEQRLAAVTSVPISVEIRQPAEGAVPVYSVEVILFITEPSGNRYEVTPSPEGDRLQASFIPREGGQYTIAAFAQMRVILEGREIVYSDFEQTFYNALMGYTLVVSAERTDLGAVRDPRQVQVTIQVTSDSPNRETLLARVEGLEEGSVFPERIDVPPNETTSFSFMVSSKDEGRDEGTFTLVFAPAGESVTLQNGEITFTYSFARGLSPLQCFGGGALSLVILVAFLAGWRFLKGVV